MLQPVDGLINASNQERRGVSWGYPCRVAHEEKTKGRLARKLHPAPKPRKPHPHQHIQTFFLPTHATCSSLAQRGPWLPLVTPLFPSTLNDQGSSRVETGAFSFLSAASASCIIGAAVDAAPSLPLRRYGEMVILFAYQIGTQLDKPEVQPS